MGKKAELENVLLSWDVGSFMLWTWTDTRLSRSPWLSDRDCSPALQIDDSNPVSWFLTTVYFLYIYTCIYIYCLLLWRVLTHTGPWTGSDWGDELESSAERRPAGRPPSLASIKKGSIFCTLAHTPPQKLRFPP